MGVDLSQFPRYSISIFIGLGSALEAVTTRWKVYFPFGKISERVLGLTEQERKPPDS